MYFLRKLLLVSQGGLDCFLCDFDLKNNESGYISTASGTIYF